MIFFTQNWKINYLTTHFNGVNENGRLSNFTLRHNLKEMNNKVKISKNRKISFSVSKPKGLNSIVKISWSWNLTKFLPRIYIYIIFSMFISIIDPHFSMFLSIEPFCQRKWSQNSNKIWWKCHEAATTQWDTNNRILTHSWLIFV